MALDAVRKNAGRLLAAALFVAGLSYLWRSGLVTKESLQTAVEDNKKYLKQEAGAQGKRGLQRAALRRCADAPMRRCADAPIRRCADAPAPSRRILPWTPPAGPSDCLVLHALRTCGQAWRCSSLPTLR